MSHFSFPQEPTPQQAACEEGVIRWIIVMLPLLLVAKILGLLAVAAILIAMNVNILSWLE
jgi:hypothetical protein